MSAEGNERIERLITDGFLFETTSVRGFHLMANYGDGYRDGARIGEASGLRKWKVRIAALPHTDDYLIDAGEYGLKTRAEYLWEFYLRHNVESAFKPFWVRDPFLRRDYLAEIAEEELDFTILCAKVYSTGITLNQRRLPRTPSPGDVVTIENNAEI